MSEVFELVPSSYAYGGDAIGKLPDGRIAFIPYAIPGERVRAELPEEKSVHGNQPAVSRFVRLRLIEVIEPSPMRVQPCCPHFGDCGGCHYQHLNYETQLQAKTSILVDQLRRIGGLQDLQVQSVFPSPNDFNYRNYVQFHLATDGKLGFKRPRSDQVLPIRECHLPEMVINRVWPQLEFEVGTLIERVGLRLGVDDDLQLILETNGYEVPELSVEDLPISVVHLCPAGPLVMAGSAAVEIEVIGRRFQVSAGSFFQTNTAIAERMVTYALEQLESRHALHSGATAFDLYCGVGLFSAFLAERVGRLVGVESSPSAVEDFVINLDEFDQVELYESPAEFVLPSLDLSPDLIILDPPRQGLDRRLMDVILQKRIPLLVYVSCDPATLARDAKRLTNGGFQIQNLALFDQFPQTYHIESISLWGKRD
jgi:23S rRNA (uracil1939-C5)-methyltransferase